VKGVRTQGPMAPDIPLAGQRPAQYVFEGNVARKLSEIRAEQSRAKAAKASVVEVAAEHGTHAA
jgi:hypothetical protein